MLNTVRELVNCTSEQNHYILLTVGKDCCSVSWPFKTRHARVYLKHNLQCCDTVHTAGYQCTRGTCCLQIQRWRPLTCRDRGVKSSGIWRHVRYHSYRRFGESYCLHFQGQEIQVNITLLGLLTMTMEALSFSETSITIYQSKGHNTDTRNFINTAARTKDLVV